MNSAAVATAALAVAGGLQLVREWRSTRLSMAGWLVMVAALATSLPSTIPAVLGTRALGFNSVSQSLEVAEPGAEALNRAGLFLIVAVAGAMTIRRLHGVRTVLRLAPLLALLLWAISVLAALRAGDQAFTMQALALAALLIATAVSPPDESVARAVGMFGLGLATVSAALAVVRPETSLLPCITKCGPIGALLAGTYGNENALGLALVMSVPFAWMGFGPRRGPAAAVYLTAAVILTGSRTALIAAAVTVAVLTATRPAITGKAARPWLLTLVAGLVAAVGATLPFWSLDQRSLTGRPHLWDLAIEHLNILTGSGPSRWPSLRMETGQIFGAGTYSVHNQWLDVLFVGGILGFAVFLGLLVALLAGQGRDRMVAALLPVLVAGAVERTWSISQVDWLTFSYLAVMLLRVADASRQEGSNSAELPHVDEVPAGSTAYASRP